MTIDTLGTVDAVDSSRTRSRSAARAPFVDTCPPRRVNHRRRSAVVRDVQFVPWSHLQNSWRIRLDGLMAVLPAWSPIALGFVASDLVLQHVWASGEG